MLRICILACLTLTIFAAPWASHLDDEWHKYKVKHGKTYSGEEEAMRRLIWEKNLKYVEEHNKKAEKGETTFRLGMNKFADMSSEEFVSTMNGLKAGAPPIKPVCKPMAPSANVNVADLPPTVDWRTKGYVTKVKNQGQCGSCWAFSCTGSLEGQHFKKTGKLVSLSESNLVDCSAAYGNQGCKGGLMDQGFTYIIQNGGIDTEESYPYRAKTGTTCKFSNSTIGSTEIGCIDIPIGSESQLQVAVANIGPIAVGIDAGHPSFQMYRDGVYKETKCSTKQLDHGVLAVGYGTQKHIFEKDEDYWLVKNSWGEDWGMEGYIMMSRNKNNMCGIATQASYPTL